MKGKIKIGRLMKRGASLMDLIALSASLIFILAACTTAKTADGIPPASASPSASAALEESDTPPVVSPSETPAPYPEYTLKGGPHLGVQSGLYPWGFDFGTAEVTTHTSGDMPGTVFYRVDGDRFRLLYRHIEETKKDVVSSIMSSSDTWDTARGIKLGDTVKKLLDTYREHLLYQPEPFPVSQDLGGDFCIYDEAYIYTRPEDDNCCLVFFVIDNAAGDKTITGIQTSLGQDGSPAYTADNVNTFAVDYSHAEKYLNTDTRAEEKVHKLFTAEGAVDRSAIFEALANFNWRLYSQLYQADSIDLIDWLYKQAITSEHDIQCVLKATKGLDGAYSEGFSDVLAKIYNADSRAFIRLAGQLDDARIDEVARLISYGLSISKDQVITELEAYQSRGDMTPGELLVIADILHYFDLWY